MGGVLEVLEGVLEAFGGVLEGLDGVLEAMLDQDSTKMPKTLKKCQKPNKTSVFFEFLPTGVRAQGHAVTRP